MQKFRSRLRTFAFSDDLLFVVIVAATLTIILNSCCLLARGRFTHTRLVDLAGGAAALASGVLVHRKRRSLAGEISIHSRLRNELHLLNEQLEAKVEERTALLESTNSFLETIVQESPLAVVVLDLEWRIRVWSSAAERLFGWTAEEVLGKSVPYIPPDRQKEWEESLARKLGGKNSFYEVQRPTKQGAHVDLLAWTSSLHAKSGTTFAYLLVYADNSERKLAEEALHNSEERFAKFMDNLPGIAFMKDVDGRYIYMNRGSRDYYTKFGIPEAILKTDHEMWPPEAADRFLRNDREALRTMKAVQVVEPVPGKDGATSQFLVNKFPVVDRGTTILCGIGIDVTELKKAERALADLQSRQQAILENISDMVWLKDLDGRYMEVNRAFEETMGMPRAKVEGKTDLELWQRDQAVKFAADDRQVMETRAPRRLEEHVDVPSGKMWIETLKGPLFNDRGDVIGTTGSARDITDRKRADEKLSTYQEQLSTLAAELSLAEERERRRIAAELHDQIGQSLALAKIKVNALTIPSHSEQSGLLGELKDALDTCITEVRSLTFQVSPPLLYEIGFGAALDWLCEWMRDNYSLDVEVHQTGPAVYLGDEERGALFRVVRELLINCGKHAGTCRVSVWCRSFGDRLEIKVEDSGAGFDASALSTSASTGFGLFNIRQRIMHMGGECGIVSAPGRGTAITISVPLSLLSPDTGEEP